MRGGGYCYQHATALNPDTMGRLVPNEQVARFLWPWVQQGYLYTTLFDAVGLKKSSTQFYEGCSMQAHTYRRLLALDVEQCATHPAWRARRRLQSLRAAGMRMDDMLLPGLSVSTVSKVCRGDGAGHVTRAVHKAALDLYEEFRDAPAVKPVPWMEKWGWVTPWAWEDIDNPHEGHRSMERVAQTEYAHRFWQRHLSDPGRQADG